jgi:DNA gyrase subunit A
LTEFSRPRANGIIAIDLADGNRLIGVGLTSGQADILLFSNGGKVVRFSEQDVRPMGRNARGVRGIKLRKDETAISLIIANPDDAAATVLTATENGYGKRTLLSDYPKRNRGGQGVISIQVSARNGQVVGATLTGEDDQAMLITNGGTLIRTPVRDISVVGRNTQGVRLIGLDDDEKLVGIEKVEESDGLAGTDANGGGESNESL